MLVPSDVIDELMGFVFRVKSFLDAYSGVLGAVTALMTMLVVVLSMRLRAREMRTLNRIGCSRFTVARVHGTEILLVLVLAVTLAGLELLTVSFCMPDLWRIL